MDTLRSLVFLFVLSVSAAFADDTDTKRTIIYDRHEKPMHIEVPQPTKEELQKPDCYFGASTSASQLEAIRNAILTHGRNYPSDPNLLP
jgi:hypothetical protein